LRDHGTGSLFEAVPGSSGNALPTGGAVPGGDASVYGVCAYASVDVLDQPDTRLSSEGEHFRTRALPHGEGGNDRLHRTHMALVRLLQQQIGEISDGGAVVVSQ
jgi:hypothetical protein